MFEPICLKHIGFVEVGTPRPVEHYESKSRYEIVSIIRVFRRVR